MGNGNMIPITHTGSTQLHASDSTFKLSNTLCAPFIKCNLISVSKFCQDNVTSVEFFQSKFLVKDLSTEATIVSGRNKNALYEWPNSSNPTSFTATPKQPIRLWDRRLDHPNNQILHFIWNTFSLPYSAKEQFIPCNSCSSNKVHRLPFYQNTLSCDTSLKRIFSDLWGPSHVLSIDKKNYITAFLLINSRSIFGYIFSSTKMKFSQCFNNFTHWLKKISRKKNYVILY